MKARRLSRVQRSVIFAGLGTLVFLAGLHGKSLLNLTVGAEKQATGQAGMTSPILVEMERPSARWLRESLAPTVETVQDAVVNISATRTGTKRRLRSYYKNPLFRDFMRDPVREFPRELRERSLGSGVIVETNGSILTNYHVVNRAESLVVTFADQRKKMAHVIGTDPETDLAVIKVDRAGLSAMKLGNSDRLQVGDFVLAVGNPFGLDHSITFGIISAVGRTDLNIAEYEDFIQTDAAINPGNSGGALVNLSGELIGINTAIASRGSSGNQGVGFSIPVNMARLVLQQILQHGRVIRGWLGVAIQSVDEVMAEELGLAQPGGALVAQVEPESPAARADIRRGDVIIAFGHQRINDANQLRNWLGQTSPGSLVEITLIRNQRERVVQARLAEMERRSFGIARLGRAANQLRTARNRFHNPLVGVEVRELTEPFLVRFHLPRGARGAVIVRIEPGSPADIAGMRQGDLIQEIDGQPITGAADVRSIAAGQGKSRVLVLVNRRGRTFYVVMEAGG